ncbi:MAG: transglycosylase domain-containing protein [Micavibrio aeruginosavorus]|uniref:peptidoglycan glycosyltransferase n=1 Tax=Micavibrio aeruginosavorus TaxID=349221 RepID=A0A7T5R1M9_9BACT|nr:MAG: transglycosylase domain-containing protein [Micavibrio aeruginosavorus]
MSLDAYSGAVQGQILDRNGVPLTYSYDDRWNAHELLPLYEIPDFLRQAFIRSEDRRFYEHRGVDWQARAGALWQNVRYRRTVRGASTITEQVVRMIHPRPRTLWSKYIEGFEASQLEKKYSKTQILEFYLNQLPYAANRRGIAQAARFYFGRHVTTLTEREMLALVVLVRAPSAFDLYRYPERTAKMIDRLARQISSGEQLLRIMSQDIRIGAAGMMPEARHFARYARQQPNVLRGQVRTTLSASLQTEVQNILDRRLHALSARNARNAAALVVDHTTGEILAWVVAGAKDSLAEASDIDAVLVPRQPGSSLKPFLYARALDKGWSAATILDDSPLSEAIGNGLHRFRNYSRSHYGPISLRESLGNSLNIPALLTIRHVGVPDYLTVLQAMRFQSLSQPSDFYDEGLALGNGEVTLFELVQAYAALANRGVWSPLKVLIEDYGPRSGRQIFSPESASLIGDILSDPWARRLEFGQGSVLNLPQQTAVKTGTSTDYRDAWAVGYNDRYVVGIWIGNLDHKPMDGVTGATGPALALRSIFTELNAERDTKRLYMSPLLIQADVCHRPQPECLLRTEWVLPDRININHNARNYTPELVRPTQGLQMARDPRIPADYQNFRFEVAGIDSRDTIKWVLNGRFLAEKEGEPTYLWAVERGLFKLEAYIHKANHAKPYVLSAEFEVK